MARKARVSVSTIGKFIAPDDSAIGIEDTEEFRVAYDSYMKSANHEFLKLIPEEKPGFYYLRPYGSEEKAEIRDYFTSISTEEGREVNEDGTPSAELVEAVHKVDPKGERFRLLRRNVVYDCIVGCTDHPMAADEVADDGTLDVQHIRWDVGTPEPKGLRESMMKDDVLSTFLFQYLFTISSLSEKEKN